ncbi:encapsulin-associated ferritin-like protein [Haliangium sp.]|uniref:encapsulin-associated ferritin-like protein n=1 Tax=Haliangium sp. TaxID=2663208 RepID=UPI003D0DD960
MASDRLHEPAELLSAETRDRHRAIVSLIEELEAVDWYQQRADACGDPELRAVLIHNKNEEIEHAMMTLEWLRRHDEMFAETMRTYLFTDRPILEIEDHATSAGGDEAAAPHADAGSLGIGSLKE